MLPSFFGRVVVPQFHLLFTQTCFSLLAIEPLHYSLGFPAQPVSSCISGNKKLWGFEKISVITCCCPFQYRSSNMYDCNQ
ncbi:hypothetical protein QQP08_021048 [Theobroma cacao]|nr:hypothetical protein QQP08_021048 [Theobroma cacao]